MRFVVLILCLLCTLIANAQVAPAINASALDGTSVHLPDPHQSVLLILGFSRKASDGVTACSKTLSHTAWNTHTATVYELAFLGSAPKPMRGLIVRAMRKDVPQAAQSHFLTVDTDEQLWRTLAAAKDESQPYVLLIDSAGRLRWRTQGACTDALVAEAARQVAAVTAR